MQLQLRERVLKLDCPQVMGVLNVTPDSFSDGGLHLAPGQALNHARTLLEEGAVIIDIGGESTRPGAQPVGVQEELDRVLPVIEACVRELDCAISIDTTKPAVMRAACTAGAHLINDVGALQATGALEAARDSGAAVCLMHMQGEPRTMQAAPLYEDVTSEVAAFLRARVAACVAAGIARERLLIDPGFGFGKTLKHNLELLARLGELRTLQVPLLVGLSRKSMFKQLLGLAPDRRLHASLAAATLAVWQGAVIVRAHDVRATVEALSVAATVARFRRTT